MHGDKTWLGTGLPRPLFVHIQSWSLWRDVHGYKSWSGDWPPSAVICSGISIVTDYDFSVKIMVGDY